MINKVKGQNKYIFESTIFKGKSVFLQSQSKDLDLLIKDINSGSIEMNKATFGLSRLLISKKTTDYYVGVNFLMESGGITKPLNSKSYIIQSKKLGILLKQIHHINDLFFFSTTVNPQVLNNTYIKKNSADTLSGKIIAYSKKIEEIDNAKFGMNFEIGIGLKILPKNRKQQVWVLPVFNENLFSPFNRNQVRVKNRNIGLSVMINF